MVFDAHKARYARAAPRREDGLTLAQPGSECSAFDGAVRRADEAHRQGHPALTVRGSCRQAEQRIQLADGGLRARQSIVSVAGRLARRTTVRVADAALELGALSLVARVRRTLWVRSAAPG